MQNYQNNRMLTNLEASMACILEQRDYGLGCKLKLSMIASNFRLESQFRKPNTYLQTYSLHIDMVSKIYQKITVSVSRIVFAAKN